jgi:hypothetical protein
MAINMPTPVSVSEVELANYFDIAYYTITNEGDTAAAAVLRVWFNASNKDAATGALTLVRNLGPAEFRGDALKALCADADARTQAYKVQGLDAGSSYALGQRDAVYAALQAGGFIG